MKITFKDLENFVACAESRTLSEASEKLQMAQPSLSLGIKKLETEIGYPLFFRSKEGFKITPQGKMLLADAISALSHLKKIKGENSRIKYRIGCHASVGMFVLGDFLKIMHKENPEIDFEITTASSYEVNKLVAKGDIDVGIVMNPLPLQGLIIRYIGEDEVAVWESKKRYEEKLIFDPHMLQATSIISRWKKVPSSTIDVPNLELIANLTESGAGFGILPKQVVKALKMNLEIVAGAPTYKDKLALVCYPELLKYRDGQQIFESLKKSFKN
jgi:DNA-binding transcriptional LysR family regulator